MRDLWIAWDRRKTKVTPNGLSFFKAKRGARGPEKVGARHVYAAEIRPCNVNIIQREVLDGFAAEPFLFGVYDGLREKGSSS